MPEIKTGVTPMSIMSKLTRKPGRIPDDFAQQECAKIDQRIAERTPQRDEAIHDVATRRAELQQARSDVFNDPSEANSRKEVLAEKALADAKRNLERLEDALAFDHRQRAEMGSEVLRVAHRKALTTTDRNLEARAEDAVEYHEALRKALQAFKRMQRHHNGAFGARPQWPGDTSTYGLDPLSLRQLVFDDLRRLLHREGIDEWATVRPGLAPDANTPSIAEKFANDAKVLMDVFRAKPVIGLSTPLPADDADKQGAAS